MRIRTKWNRYWELVEIGDFQDKKTLGECRPTERQIVLKKDDPKKVYTLIHELIHALDIDFDLKLSHAQVYGLEKALEKLYKLNKNSLYQIKKIIGD